MGITFNPLLQSGLDFTGSSGGGGGGVTTLNGLSGAVTLAAGANITLTPSGNTITIASTGGGSGANTSLSNLIATSINQALVFGSGVAGDLQTSSPAININSQDLTLGTGNATGSGNSGNIILLPGSGAIRGKIQIQDGSEGSIGQVWTSTDAFGSGVWATSSSGFANPMTNTGDMIYSNPGSTPQRLPIGAPGQVLGTDGTIPIWSNLPGATAFTLAASTQINTDSSAITAATFTTFDNSPAFLFTPQISGTYKIYCDAVIFASGAGFNEAVYRIINTSGGATLLQESQGQSGASGAVDTIQTVPIQSVYNLVANTTYVFDIQAKNISGTASSVLTGLSNPFYMFCEGVGLQGTLNTTGSSYDIFASNQVTTRSSIITTSPGFSTADNSPAFTFTPAISGKYKVYSSGGLLSDTAGGAPACRIINTSGGATLLQESQGISYSSAGAAESSASCQSVYDLIAGTTYVFDIQLGGPSNANVQLDGTLAPFYMFAEGIGLSNNAQQFPVNFRATGAGSWGGSNPIALSSIAYDSNSAYNPSTGQYTIPYDGFYIIGWNGNASSGSKQVQIWVNGVFAELIDNGFTSDSNAAGLSTTLKLKKNDIVTWVATTTFATNQTTQWVSSTSLAQGILGPQGSSNGSSFAYYSSTLVNTQSSTTLNGTFQTFNNSPALTFTPTISGIYKVYCSAGLFADANQETIARIFNTSGGGTLLQESEAMQYGGTQAGGAQSANYFSSTYSLVGGTTYIFDIQGKETGGSGSLDGSIAPFYMFAEGIGLQGGVTQSLVAATVGMAASVSVAGSPVQIIFDTVLADTNNAYNTSTGVYTIPSAGWYDIIYQGTSNVPAHDNFLVYIQRNGSTIVYNNVGVATLASPAVGVQPCPLTNISYLFSAGDQLTFFAQNQNGNASTWGGDIHAMYFSIAGLGQTGVSRIVKSLSTGSYTQPNGGPNPVLDNGGVNPISVTVICNGGDVEIGFMGDGLSYGSAFTDQSPTDSGMYVDFLRDGTIVHQEFMYMQNNVTIEIHYIPASSFRFIDTPTPGSHTYTVQTTLSNANRGSSGFGNSILYARPLA